MRNAFILAVTCLFCGCIHAQNSQRILVLDSLTNDSLPGVNVRSGAIKLRTQTDMFGMVSLLLSDGTYLFMFSYPTYETKTLSLTFPLTSDPFIVRLKSIDIKLDEVLISSTRTHSRVEDIPLKIEVIGQEDMDEENGIKPGNISSLLGDVSGIQLQQTSPVSGNYNVRIQGLNGTYTQLLRDGIPMYDGFSADFGIMQLPPLDLKQIEIVKGSASTLYGGGAIAGLINLITKDPSVVRDASVTMNYSSLTERNFNFFSSQRFRKTGYTFFTGYTGQNAVDVDGDGFSDVPGTLYGTLHPKLYYYFSDSTKLTIGLSAIYEKRKGGDMQVLLGNTDSNHVFFERQESWRNCVDLLFSSTNAAGNTISLKAAGARLDRTVTSSNYIFGGIQYHLFSELSCLINRDKHSFVIGANFITDHFQVEEHQNAFINTITNNTAGVFVQHTWKVKRKLMLESGVRADGHTDRGVFPLPRIALLYKFSPVFSTRLHTGLGYKVPNAFAKQFMEYDPNKVIPIDDSVRSEKSLGAGFELIWKKSFANGLTFFADQSFFYTTIDKPVITQTTPYGDIYFDNAKERVTSAGSDTYIRMSTEEFELYIGYTYTHAEQPYDTVSPVVPLYPPHRFSSVISYEVEERWRFGAEGSFFGYQYTPDGERKPGYLFIAAMVGREVGNMYLVLNCENLLDYRQQKKEAVVLPPYTQPAFRPLWAPVDGRVVNLSVRVKF